MIPVDLYDSQANSLLPPLYKVELLDATLPLASSLTRLPKPNGAVNDKVMISTVQANRRLTSDNHFQDTRHIVLKLPSVVNYEPGDVVMIQPRNDPELIAEFIGRFGLKHD